MLLKIIERIGEIMNVRPACKCLETVSVRDMREVLSNFRNSPGDIQTITRSKAVLNFSDISCGTVTANLPNDGGQLDIAICYIFSYRPLMVNTSTCVRPKCKNCSCIEDPCVISIRERLELHKENNQLLNVYSTGLNSITRVNVIEVRDGVATFKEPGVKNVIFVSLWLIESLEPTV